MSTISLTGMAAVPRWRERVPLTVIILAVILLALILPPLIFLLTASVHTTNYDGSFDQFTLKFFGELLTSKNFFTSLSNTAIYSVGSAVVGLIFGITLAVIVERTNAPIRRLAFFGAIVSLAIPHVLYVVAWLLLLGRSGPLNQLWVWFTGAAKFDVYSLGGMIFIEGMSFVPLTFLLMSSVLRSTDAAFEEASMMSGAGPLSTFWKVTLKMGMPGVLALLLMSFIRAFESFEVPAIVGLAGNIEVVTTSIYQNSRAVSPPNFGQAGAYSVFLLVFLSAMLYFYGRLSRHAHKYQTITGKGYRPRTIDLGPWRWAATGLMLVLLFLVIGLPLLIIMFASLQPFFSKVDLASFSRMTFSNYTNVIGPGFFRETLVNTLILGSVTASIVVPFTAICAWLAVRRRPGGWFLDQLATAPLVFPSIVMGVAFLNVFVRIPYGFYGTLGSVILASAVGYLPYGMRYAYSGVLQIHNDLEEASTAAGATQERTFMKIVFPLLATSMVSCWLFVFLLAVRAMALPLLLVGPGSSIVAVSLFDLWQNGQVTELAAMGMIWVSLMFFITCVFYYIAQRYRFIAA